MPEATAEATAPMSSLEAMGIDQHLFKLRSQQLVSSSHINYAFERGTDTISTNQSVTRADAAAYICNKLPKDSASRKLLTKLHRLSEEQINSATHNPMMPRRR